MDTSNLLLEAPRPAIRARRYSVLGAAGVHALALAAIFGLFHASGRLAPYRLPGTEHGTRLLTYYSPGSPEHSVSKAPVKKAEPNLSAKLTPAPSAAPKQEAAAAPLADAGSGTAVQSGVGEGDISIALQTFFPYPKPDLTQLPRGTKGDVILDATIDEHGKISGLTLIQGLGAPVDDTVIATVKEWSYTPAMKNGVPVPSEQELRFHYERG